MELFSGSGVALVTPFKNNKVDFQKLQLLINWHIRKKSDALIILGTTGEAATLTDKEKKAIIDFTIKVANKRIFIIVGTGTNSTQTTIDMSVYAEKAGANALLVVTPYYNKPSQKGLFAHYKELDSQVQIPIILYNVPSRTGVNLTPETVYELSKLKNISALKEASGDISQVAKIIDLCGDELIVYAGNDDQTIPILALGGRGVISVTANIIPEEIHQITNQYLTGDKKLAVEQFMKYRKLNQVLFIETNPVVVKNAMNLMGLNVGTCRLPLVEMEPKNQEVLKEVLEEYRLLVK
jgi:4-hydroxy-tetrahydrodipicolinate synthase